MTSLTTKYDKNDAVPDWKILIASSYSISDPRSQGPLTVDQVELPGNSTNFPAVLVKHLEVNPAI